MLAVLESVLCMPLKMVFSVVQLLTFTSDASDFL